jgi:hypothetical protein
MPTSLPRVQVSLKPEQYDTLRRLATLRGVSMASIVAELVATVEPVLRRSADAMEAVETAQLEVNRNLRRVVEQADADLRPIVESVGAHMRAASEELQRLAESGGNPSPRPVITGATTPQRKASRRRAEG